MTIFCISGHPIADDANLAATASMPGFRTHHLCRECAVHPIWRDHILSLSTLPHMRLVPDPSWLILSLPLPLIIWAR